MPKESSVRIECPYCGLTDWVRIQIVHKDPETTVHLCRCGNCNRVFYLFRTRLRTYTVELEQVEV